MVEPSMSDLDGEVVNATDVLPCAEKITYDTRVAAVGAAAAVEWQRGQLLKAYQCRYCQLWHLASN